MTKAERLLYLIDLMHSSEGLRIEEICGRCRVSQRTIYRDLRSLDKLNYRVEFDQGYRLAKGTPMAVRLAPEEIRLIRFCLRTSRIAISRRLRSRLRALDRKLARANRPDAETAKNRSELRNFRFLNLPRGGKPLETRLNELFRQ